MNPYGFISLVGGEQNSAQLDTICKIQPSPVICNSQKFGNDVKTCENHPVSSAPFDLVCCVQNKQLSG